MYISSEYKALWIGYVSDSQMELTLLPRDIWQNLETDVNTIWVVKKVFQIKKGRNESERLNPVEIFRRLIESEMRKDGINDVATNMLIDPQGYAEKHPWKIGFTAKKLIQNQLRSGDWKPYKAPIVIGKVPKADNTDLWVPGRRKL